MENEFQLLNSAKKYLESLGYPSSNIVLDTGHGGTRVDLVVRDDDNTLLVVEIKSNMFEIIRSDDQIGYHPITRSLQKIASETGAKYYIISNGKKHSWLVTGETGRPEEIREIKFKEFTATTLSNSQFTKDILLHVKEFIRNYSLSGDHIYDMSLIIYSRIFQEANGVDTIPDEIQSAINFGIENRGRSTANSPIALLTEAVSRLSFVKLLENRFAAMEFIDDLQRDGKQGWTIPRWVTTLMVKLIDLAPNDKIIDIFSQRGSMLSAARLQGYKQVTSYFVNSKDLFWIRIQRHLGSPQVYEEESEFKLAGVADMILLNDSCMGVLLAFPFNTKIDYVKASYLGHSGINAGNALFIESALRLVRVGGRIVTIVPDSILSSKNEERAREYFLSKVDIEAIISLPIDTFKPFAAVKCSIMVLRRKSSPSHKRTLFASITKIPHRNFENLFNEPSIKRLIESIELTRKYIDFTGSQDIFYVDSLSASNLHYSQYWREYNVSTKDNQHPEYQSIPLKNLVKSISRGNAVVQSNEGDIPYIGPAALRTLQIIKEKLSTTSSDKIPRGRLKRIEQDEIVVNMIGPYRGATALVGPDSDGYLINRHVVVMKPDTDLVLPGYLALAMNSNFVKEQLFDRSTGTVIPSLNTSLLENIYLPIPNLQVQEQIYREYVENLTQLETLRLNGSILQSKINSQLTGLGKAGIVP